MRQLATILVFSALHFAASVGGLFVGGAVIMGAFDGSGSDLFALAAALGISVLHFPVANFLAGMIPGARGLGTIGQYGIFIVNSVLWGYVGSVIWPWWRDRRRVAAGA